MKPEIPGPSPENIAGDREKIWREKVEKVGKRLDGLDNEMDPGIIETVAALNLHGINTSQSCEGHLDRGIPSPWVAIEAKNKPDTFKERYHNQVAIYEEIAQKHGIAIRELRDGAHEAAWHEACLACKASGETDAWKAWQAENKRLRKQVEELIQEYEKQQMEKSVSSVSITAGYGPFRIFTGGPDFNLLGKTIKELPATEQEAIAVRLREHQAEMRRFTDFLKQRYLTEIPKQ